MIIGVDKNGIVHKASTHYTEADFVNSSGVYEVDINISVGEAIGRTLSDFTNLTVLVERLGDMDFLPSLKGRAVRRVNNSCRNQIIAGFESSALGTPHQYPFKEEDQSNLMSTFMLAKEFNVSKVFKCWDSAGVDDYRLHTVAQLQQVGQDAETHKMTALIKARTLKAQINAATTAAEVEAIVW